MNSFESEAHSLTPEDAAFDRAFREAAERELTTPQSLIPARRSLPPVSPEVLERRLLYRRVVLWVVGAAGMLTLIALAVGIVT
jgi:hypothetical protein